MTTIRERLSATKGFVQNSRVPIIADLLTASWSNWREGIKEIVVTLFFSLMPLWLGLLIVKMLTLTDGVRGFIENFASSSDLGILSASLLGPMIYMMFREESDGKSSGIVPGFPSGLWFIMITLACCIVATVIYCFAYVSELKQFFNEKGEMIHFIRSDIVAVFSWTLLIVVVVLILFACTIRNSMETQPPRMMSGDTQDYVSRFQAAQDDAGSLAEQMGSQQGNSDATPA